MKHGVRTKCKKSHIFSGVDKTETLVGPHRILREDGARVLRTP